MTAANLNDLDGRVVRLANGHPLFRVGVQAQFFFNHGDEPEQRVAMVDAAAQLAALASGALQVRTGDKRPLPVGRTGFPAQQRAEAEASDLAEAFLLQLKDEDIPPSDLVVGLACDADSTRVRNWLSYLYGAIPPAVVREDGQRYVQAVVRAAQLLQPEYGSAGYAPVAYEPGMESHIAKHVWPWLVSAPGLDFLGTHDLRSKPGRVAAVNWLTVVAQEALEAIGGSAELASRLRAEATTAGTRLAAPTVADDEPDTPASLGQVIRMHPYQGGVVIQAGELPGLGSESECVPAAYLAVHEALRPVLRLSAPDFNVPRPTNNKFFNEVFPAWYRRFDR